jgi:hypothetical protein
MGERMKVKNGLGLASIGIAIGFTAAIAGADAPAAEDSDSRQRSSGFFAMDREDHRDWTFEVAGGAMYLDADGKIGFESNFGDVVFGVNTLDLEREWSGWARAELKLAGKHHLRFAFIPADFEGDTFVEIPLPPDDPIFVIGDRVESRAKLHTYQLSYLYDFNLGKYVTLSPSLTLGLIDAKIRIDDETLGIDFYEDQLVPLPELGLRLELYPCSRLSVFGEAKGFTIGSKATEWDASGGIKLFVNRHFYVEGSYRAIDYDVDWLDVVIDTRFHGPFVGGGLRF